MPARQCRYFMQSLAMLARPLKVAADHPRSVVRFFPNATTGCPSPRRGIACKRQPSPRRIPPEPESVEASDGRYGDLKLGRAEGRSVRRQKSLRVDLQFYPEHRLLLSSTPPVRMFDPMIFSQKG